MDNSIPERIEPNNSAGPAGRRADLSDVILEHVLADEAELREQLVDVVIDRDAYRALAHEAIAQLARTTAQLEAARRLITAQRDELRQFTSRRAA
jgi:hypothetical protein